MALLPTPRRPWTDLEREELRNLAALPGQSLGSIAQKLGRTEAAIENQMTNLGIRLIGTLFAKRDRIDNILFNGDPLTFAITDNPCARCAVRESVHHKHGCGQFAAEVRVRIR